MTDVRRTVHFLTSEDPSSVRAWSPDDEPGRFATGEGHHLLELYARLRDRGAPVSVGRHPPHRTGVVVASLEHMARWTGRVRTRGRVLFGLAAARVGQAVVIRGDYPLDVPPPPFVRSQVAPTRAAAALGLGTWLPFLPQRGMHPRDDRRRGRLRSVGLMAFDWNVPEQVADGSLATALAPLGIDLHLRTDPVRWAEFRDIDAVLCMRRPGPYDDEAFTRKPVTKLTNAWVAGCIPLIQPDVGYTELALDGVDAIIVRSNDDIVAALARLQQDPTLLGRLEAAGDRRAPEFGTEHVLDLWERFLWDTPHDISSRRAAAVDAARTVIVRAARPVRRGTAGGAT